MTDRMTPWDVLEKFDQECREASHLFAEKNAAYDSNFLNDGLQGCIYEVIGAATRLRPMVLQAEDHGMSQRDKIVDVLRDIHNYANMALICLGEDNWDGNNVL